MGRSKPSGRVAARWKLTIAIASHVIAWPLLAMGITAVTFLFYFLYEGGFKAPGPPPGDWIAWMFVMTFVGTSTVGVVILVAVIGWRHWLSKIVIGAELLLLLAAIAGLAVAAYDRAHSWPYA